MFIASPMFHATGLSQLIVTLALGSTVVVRRRFEPEATLRALADHRCTALVLVPTMLSRIAATWTPMCSGGYDTSRLEVILTAGRRSRRTSATVPSTRSVTCSTTCTARPKSPSPPSPPPTSCVPRRAPSAARRGAAWSGCTTARAGGSPAPRHDRPGVRRQRAGVRRLHRRRHTRRSSTGCCPAATSATSTSDGLLFVDGRDDDMIVSGGENVFPAEIENLLVDHAGRGRRRGHRGGRPGLRPAAAGVRGAARPGRRRTRTNSKAHVRANLARYKVPRDVVFLDELPRNATGKVLRGTLAKL